jgi:hypothetical protein
LPSLSRLFWWAAMTAGLEAEDAVTLSINL